MSCACLPRWSRSACAGPARPDTTTPYRSYTTTEASWDSSCLLFFLSPVSRRLRYARHLGDHIRCRAVAIRDSLKQVSSTLIIPRAICPSQQPAVSLGVYVSHFPTFYDYIVDRSVVRSTNSPAARLAARSNPLLPIAAKLRALVISSNSHSESWPVSAP